MRADCEEIHEITAELALGIASGEERARALAHAAHCRDCRRELEQLTKVVDDLLLVAPEEEPPAGFEDRVLAAIGPPKTARKRFRIRAWRPLVAVAVGAAIASAVLVNVYHDDHKLANEYRQALAAADGSRFVATPLRDAAGVKRGSLAGSNSRGVRSCARSCSNGSVGESRRLCNVWSAAGALSRRRYCQKPRSSSRASTSVPGTNDSAVDAATFNTEPTSIDVLRSRLVR